METRLGILSRTVTAAFLIGCSVLLALVLAYSLKWPLMHDSPIMFYLAYLVGHGSVPYRDFYDMNLPGTYGVYLLIGVLSGYRDLWIRFADILILIAIFVLTWIWMRPFGRKAAWAGCVLWGLVYLRYGPALSLQREYLILVPILLAILTGTRTRTLETPWKYSVVGLLFGIAFTMRPHSAIGLVLLLLFGLLGTWPEKSLSGSAVRTFVFRAVLPATAGLLFPALLLALYLWSNGALGAFVDMARYYWPLYTHLTGAHESIGGWRRYVYMLGEYRRLGGLTCWLAAASTASFALLYGAKTAHGQKRQVALMVALALGYSTYPIFAGQFWLYHWLLFLYFAIQLGALCLADVEEAGGWGRKTFLLAVLMMTLFFGGLRTPPGLVETLEGIDVLSPKGGRVNEIATFLKNNLRPGDTVQPLDWTGGAVHAMLIARASLATPFVYDFHFYHHISNPYIQRLRRGFMQDLGTRRPRYIVEITGEDKPWVSGPDTTRHFEELRSLLARDYRSAVQGEGYVIHERIDPARQDRK